MNDTAMIPSDELEAESDRKRKVALLHAVGLDKVPPEQRELALNLAKRYDLDLLLKHLVLIDGRAYVTRDGLLHIAHRSGVFDGMEVTDPVLDGDFWRARCSVFRRDMSRPFTYSGRYPVKGRNATFGPEMAVKVAEVASLRRAFDVSAPTVEERWDDDGVPAGPPPKPTLSDVIAKVRPVDPPTTISTSTGASATVVLADHVHHEIHEPVELPDADPSLIVTEYDMSEPDEVVPTEPVPDPIPEPTMSTEEAINRFRRAVALVPKATVTEAAKRLYPDGSWSSFTATEYIAIASELGVEL